MMKIVTLSAFTPAFHAAVETLLLDPAQSRATPADYEAAADEFMFPFSTQAMALAWLAQHAYKAGRAAPRDDLTDELSEAIGELLRLEADDGKFAKGSPMDKAWKRARAAHAKATGVQA